MSEFTRRARLALHDMQGRVDHGKLAMFGQTIDHTEHLEELLDVDRLAHIIRIVDGSHSLGASELAERIIEAQRAALNAMGDKQPPDPPLPDNVIEGEDGYLRIDD